MPESQSYQPGVLLFSCSIDELQFTVENFLTEAGPTPSVTATTIEPRSLQIEYISAPLEEHSVRRVFYKSDESKLVSGLKIGMGKGYLDGHHSADLHADVFGEIVGFGAYLGAEAVLWEPARILCGFEYFKEAVLGLATNGIFPVLATVHLSTDDGAFVRTEGLSWFSGQEVEFELGGLSLQAAIQRVVRLVHDVAVNGPIIVATKVPDLIASNHISLAPSCEGNVLNVAVRAN